MTLSPAQGAPVPNLLCALLGDASACDRAQLDLTPDLAKRLLRYRRAADRLAAEFGDRFAAVAFDDRDCGFGTVRDEDGEFGERLGRTGDWDCHPPITTSCDIGPQAWESARRD